MKPRVWEIISIGALLLFLPLFITPAGAEISFGGMFTQNIGINTNTQISASGGTPPYTLTAASDIVSISKYNDTTFLIKGVRAGSTTVTLRDAAGRAQSNLIQVYPSIQQRLHISFTKYVFYPNDTDILTVTGGTPPYSVSLSDTGVLKTQATDASHFQLTGLKAGTTVITVKDSKGYIDSITRVVTAPPSQLQISYSQDSLVGKPFTLTVAGGTPPYRVTSQTSDVSISGAAVDGRSFSITSNSAANIVLAVNDNGGQSRTVSITLRPRQLPLAVQFLSDTKMVTVGNDLTITVSGGTPPYTVVIPADSIVSGQEMKTGTYKLVARKAGDQTFKVYDLYRAETSFTLQVKEAFGFLPDNSAPLKTHVSHWLKGAGGTPPYTFVSSNSKLVIHPSGYMLTMEPGIYRMTMTDAAGRSLSKDFTFVINLDVALKLSLSSETVMVGESVTLTVSGGTPPYQITVPSNLKIGQSTSINQFVLTGGQISIDRVTVAARDSKGLGGIAQITVKPSPQQAPAISISSRELYVGDTTALKITGGNPPYRISDKQGVVSIQGKTPTDYVLQGVKAGTASLEVRDSKNIAAFSYVTVKEKPIPKVPKVEVIITDPNFYLEGVIGRFRNVMVSGGTKPYMVNVSSNLKVSDQGVSPTGSTVYTISALASGAGTVTIRDAQGNMKTITVLVRPGKSP
jgi:hypothetical protein